MFEGIQEGGPWSKILPELVDVASDGRQFAENARRLWAGLEKLCIHEGSNACWQENLKLPAKGLGHHCMHTRVNKTGFEEPAYLNVYRRL